MLQSNCSPWRYSEMDWHWWNIKEEFYPRCTKKTRSFRKSIKEYIKGQSHKVYLNIRDETGAKITEDTQKINRRKSPFLDGPGCFKFCVWRRAVTGGPHPPGSCTSYNLNYSIIGQLHWNCFNYRAVASAYSIINSLSEHPQICTFQKYRREHERGHRSPITDHFGVK